MSATVPTGLDLETPDVLGDDASPRREAAASSSAAAPAPATVRSRARSGAERRPGCHHRRGARAAGSREAVREGARPPGGLRADGQLSDAAPVLPPCDRQPRRARHAGHPRRARAQRPPRRADTRHRALHGARARRDVRPPRRRGSRARRRLPRPRRRWSAPCARRAPMRSGSGGASSRSRPSSPNCASGSASSSSGPTRRSCVWLATGSLPSGSPKQPACRWRRGAAVPSRPSTRRSGTPRASGSRS